MAAAKQIAELRDLDAIRLYHDWTWAQLAAAMGAAGFPVAPRTLHYLIKGGDPHDPRDRTLHKIREYVAVQTKIDAPGKKRNARRRARRQDTAAAIGVR